MNRVYATIISVLSFFSTQAQTANAVVFSESGEKFTLMLNGEKQNSTPQSNVKMTNLTGEFYQARVDFEDATLLDFTNGNFAVQKGMEVTYMIKKNKKGEYVLRFNGQSELTGASTSMGSTSPSEDTRRIADVDDGNSEESTGSQITPANQTTITQTTTTTTKPTTTSSENVAIGMNVGGVNMGINVNIQDSGMNQEMEEDVKTTTTTKTTTSATNTNVSKPREVVVAESVGGCSRSMTPAAFASAKSSIESKSFEDAKMTIAKQMTKANCLTAAQIKEVMALFSFEESKIEYAKYSYDFCFNQGDYYQINDAFTFESSIDELNKFLETK